MAVRPGHTLSLTETLFPDSSSELPQNKLLNMTFDCTTKQLDVHIQVSEGVEVIPRILSFSNLVLSLRVTFGAQPHFHSVILSAQTQLFSMSTFVAVEYKFNTKKIAIKGVPTDTTSLNMQNVLEAVSGASLKVPSSMNTISQITFFGIVENGMTTIAIKGKSGKSAVAVVLQKSGSKGNAAFLANIDNFNLAVFVKTALNIDITSIPLFGTFIIPKFGFSAATGKITSSLLPRLYESGSPLEAFGNTLPSGVSAYFTVNITGVSVDAIFSGHKFAFKVTKAASLSVKQLLDQIPKLKNLDSLPKMVTDILNSKLSGFNFDPESKFLELGLMIPELTVVPKILKLTNVNFKLGAMIGQNQSIQTLKFSGIWKFSSVNLNTSIDYDGEKKVLKLRTAPESSGTSLSIATLVKNVAGVGGKLPSVLTSLSLSSVVGNVYNNGKYFLVMSGSVSGGKLYLLFYKGSEGVNVGIAASLQSFQLSTLVRSTTGADITSVPYFGTLVVPAMAISITSGVIESPALPHLFGEGSPLLVYGDTIPAGVTFHFDLDIGEVKAAAAKFYDGVLAFQINKSVDFSVQALASKIPVISNAMQTLPTQIRNVLNAKVISFTFNSTSKDLSIEASLSRLTLVSGFLSISNVSISYDGTLGRTLNTRMLEFSGTWEIGKYAIVTRVIYNGASKELTLTSQSSGGKDISISNVLESLAGTTVPLPPVISSFTFTGIIGKIADGTTLVIFNGKVGSGKISAVFQKTSTGLAGAVVVDIVNFKLAELVKTALNIDITSIPLFGTLTISKLGFSAATGKITSSLLPRLYESGSPLEAFGNTLPSGVSAYFTVNITGVSVDATFSGHKFAFKVTKTASLSVKQLLDQIPKLGNLNSLPKMVTDILNSRLSGFNFDPESKFLKLGLMVPELSLIPKVLKLTYVKFMLGAMLGQNRSIQTLKFSGTWKFSAVSLNTSIDYDGEKKVFQVKATPESNGTSLSIAALVKTAPGVGGKLPSVLTSLSLSSVVGHVYNKGKYFLVISGTVSGGKLYLLFYKGSEGVKVGIAASLQSFQLSTLVRSTTGADITSVPYFGTLVVPAMAISITSGVIESPALPHLFGEGSPLLVYGDTLPAGVTFHFDLDIGEVKAAAAKFYDGVLVFQINKSVDFSVQALASKIPVISNAMQTLPTQIRNILSAKITSFSFNSTSKDLSIEASLSRLNLVSGFLSISNVSISYDGTLGKTLNTRMLEFSGTWEIGKYAILTDIVYNGASKEFTITSQSSGGKDISISNVLESLAGTTVPLPPVISSFTFTGITGKIADGTTLVIFNGKVGSGKISVVFQKTSTGSAGAVVVDIVNFKLAELVKTALNIDITSIPLFGTLTISELGFSAATGKITSSLLPRLYESGSPLEAFGNTLPSGVSAYFTVNITGVSVDATFSGHKFAFKVTKTASLSVKQLLDQIPKLKNLDSLPKMVTDILNSKLSGFNFDPESKFLELGLIIPELTVVPKILKLTNVNFKLGAMIGQNHSIQTLKFSGIWKFSAVNLNTSIDYDGEKKVLKLRTAPESSGTPLSITTLVKSVAGVGGKLPSVLTSLSLSSVVGNVYNNGKYFLVMSGTVPGGKLYLLFYRGSEGVNVGIAASLQSFQLSTLVRSTTGADITSVPYFGTLVVPAMAISITSGVIKSPALPHLFGEGSPLLVYGDTLPAGVTFHFDLDIGEVKAAAAKFYDGVLAFQINKSVDFSVQALASKIPVISNAMQRLPTQIRNILSAKITSFSFNSTSKDLSIKASLSRFTLVSGFLSIFNVSISYDGTLGKKLNTKMLEFSGTWEIGKYAIVTSVVYNGASKELTLTSQSSGGKDLSISNVLQTLAGTTVPLPPVISSFTFTGITGKTADGTTLVIFNGKVGSGKISVVFQKTSTGLAGAVVVDIMNFKLVELVKSATGADISAIPFFGTLEIPELKFAAATNNITTPILGELAGNGSALEWFKTGIVKGVSGRFVIQIGNVSRVAVSLFDNKLDFKVPVTSSLSLDAVLSTMPNVKNILNTLPSQIKTILSAKITAFSYDPDINELDFSGSLKNKIEIVPQFVSLINMQISLVLVLGQQIHIKTLYISGDWMLKKLLISTRISYNREGNKLDITGELNTDSREINIQELMREISGQDLSIPSVLSSVKVSNIRGNNYDDVTLITLSGSVGNGRIFLIYQKSPSGSAVAFAADVPRFRFSSLVSSATGIDISNIPLFGHLIISQIGFIIASNHISNPLLSGIFPSKSPLGKFGESISKGVTASFSLDLANAKGIVADFAEGKLYLQVPKTVNLSLSTILTQIAGLKQVIDSLPRSLRDIGNTILHQLYFCTSTEELKLVGSLNSLSIIPHFLSLQNIEFEFEGSIGKGSNVKFMKFKGDWIIKSLSFTIEVLYNEDLLLVSGFPTEDKGLNIKEVVKDLTNTNFNIPSVVGTLNLTRVLGKFQDGMLSIVLMGETSTQANVSIVYEQSTDNTIIAFAADVPTFQLSELVKTATGKNITSVPFFGKLTILDLSFVISSKEFTTENLPDLNVEGVHVPKQMLLENIPAGVKGHFIADIGSALGVNAEFSNKIVKIELFNSSESLSLQSLLSAIPEIKPTIDSLPTALKQILSANITKLEFKPASRNLVVSLYLETLTLVPNIASIEEIKIFLDASLTRSQSLVSVQVNPYSYQYYPLQSAQLQAVSINSLKLEGTWVMRGIEVKTSVLYNKVSGNLIFKGIPNNGSGLNITDLIEAFTDSDLPLPSVLSSLQLIKLTALSSSNATTVILISRTKKANVYILFQKSQNQSATAIVADIQDFRLVDLIKTVINTDLSAVPFIKCIVISSLAFSASTNVINTPLLTKTFESDSQLQKYESTIPKGLKAHFKVQIGGKFGIEVSYADKLLDFVVPKGVNLSLNNLLSEIPSISSVIKKLPSPICDLLGSKLKAMRFHTSTKAFSVASYMRQISVIPNILEVKNLEISLVVVLSSTNGGLQFLNFSADWVLRKTTVQIKVYYDRESEYLSFVGIPKTAFNIEELISALTGINLPIPSVINSVKLRKVLGRKSGETFTFIFSGNIGNKVNVHLVYQKVEKTSHIAIAAGTNLLNFADLVQSTINIDITGIPFFGNLILHSVAISISKGVITAPLLDEVFTNSSLTKYGSTIPDGVTAMFETPIGNYGIIGSYKDKILSLTVPHNKELLLGTLISLIPGVNTKSLDIGSVFGDILRTKVKRFSFNVLKKEVSVEMFLQNITFYENILSIRNFHLRLRGTLSTPISVGVEGSGVIAFGSTDYRINLHRDTHYTLTIETEKLPLFGIVTTIGARVLPEDLQTLLESTFDIDILNARIVYQFGVTPQQIKLSGTPQIFGLETTNVTAVAFKYSGHVEMVNKFDIGNVNIADVIKDLLGVSLHFTYILDQNVDLTMIVSPSTIEDITFLMPEFRGYNKLIRGVSLSAQLHWPPKCAENPFCAVAKATIGQTQLTMFGTIISSHSFSLLVSIGNMNLGGGVVLKRAGLEFVVGTSPSFGIVGSIELKTPAVTLNAAIRATLQGVKLEGSMSGCWNNAFGSPYLTICNLFLAMTLVPTPLPITGLEFGGRIEVGKKSCGKPATAEGYIGINTVNPNENYFYANVGPVTFQSFFNALCIGVSLPKPLAESGFPNGFQTSFSLLGKELPHAGISIPIGFRFKGTLNFLGLLASADINLSPDILKVNITLPPLKIAGLFKMYRSNVDKSKGPFVDADINKNTPPKVKASGFVEVLGISVLAQLSISSMQYEVFLEGKFLNLFQVSLRIHTSYSKKISDLNFLVEGHFKNDLFDKIAKSIRDGLKKSADEASNRLTAAQNKIKEQQAKLDRAIDNLEGKKRDVDRVKGTFDSAISKVESAERAVDDVCSIRSCGSGKHFHLCNKLTLNDNAHCVKMLKDVGQKV